MLKCKSDVQNILKPLPFFYKQVEYTNCFSIVCPFKNTEKMQFSLANQAPYISAG